MSMLAERRQKPKWTLNPRGKWWTEDSNKFGQKMLEKMGWTKGKGLGINEQGITEFSSISHKNDITGLGYDKSFEAWTEHQEKFGDFLQQLNGNQDQDAVEKSVDANANFNEQSIELKSKQSHARVHYKKFTRGKDVNRYKSKDLANIFGQKELIEKTQVIVEKNDNIRGKDVVDVRDNWYGVNTINGGNMIDYFKLKLNCNMTDCLKYNVKSKNDTNLSSITDNRTTDFKSENDQYNGFEFTSKTEDTSMSSYGALKNSDDKSNYAFDNPCLGLNSSVETACSTNDSSAKSIKKRKKDFEDDNSQHTMEIDKNNARKKLKTGTVDSDYKNGFINPALNLDTKSEEDCNGKEFEIFRTQFGLENCGLDLTDERNNKKRVTFNDHVMLYKYDINSTKKKKKGEVTLDKFEVENKKNKKKRKHCESTATSTVNGFVNEALDILILSEEINDNELNEHKNKKNKKRRISKTSNLETIQESPEKESEIIIEDIESSIVENGETDNVEQKSKKKKKKDKKEKRAKVEVITVLDTINEESDIEIVEVISNKKIQKIKDSKEEETVISKKCKKKKKKEKKNCKNEKLIQTEINNDQQDIKILDESNSKQQQNDYLIESENKAAVIIETLQCTVPVIKDEKPLERTKQKKKKRKNINKEECSSEINVCNIEREISDKENADEEQTSNTKKLAEKDKKSKKLKDKNVSDVEDSSNPNEEVVDLNVTKQDKIENTEFTDTPSKKGKVINAIDNIINSPWNIKARMPKKMLITLFHNNAILEFPGSNIHNIKGYGIDVESEQYVE